MLPFGLRSAPKIFNAVADGLEWYLRKCGVRHVFHYLDDFIVLGAPNSTECCEALQQLDSACGILGIPVAEHKRDGPTTKLTFLGIEIDTRESTLRLPADKLERLQGILASWGDRTTCSRRELESLVGLLNHACKVVRSGRTFLRRMLDLLKGAPMHRLRPHVIRLNRDFRSDLAWWQSFVRQWNGVSFLPPPHQQRTSFVLASDASGTWGCGAWYNTHWFQLPWDATSVELPIAVKELLPIILACAVWGRSWSGGLVHCHCDNQAVVASLRSRTSQNKHSQHMLRALAFIEARYDLILQPYYINTKHNVLADALSRNQLSVFLSKVPQADKGPSPPPSHLISLLMDPEMDWLSHRWRSRFSGTFRRV